jgi:hypothetical protein
MIYYTGEAIENIPKDHPYGFADNSYIDILLIIVLLFFPSMGGTQWLDAIGDLICGQ